LFAELDDELHEPRDHGRVFLTLTDPFVRDGIRALCEDAGKVAADARWFTADTPSGEARAFKSLVD
jgi:hypothetical protein